MISDIKNQVKSAKLTLLQMHYNSHVGHLGGNLSVIDSLYTVFSQKQPQDIVLVSKGHAAGAIYSCLAELNLIKKEDLHSFHKDGTLLAGHPAVNTHKEIVFATGSLGHGLSLSAGLALAKRLKLQATQQNSVVESLGLVHCFTSDGDWQEGSTWEALIFLTHQELSNLVIWVDANRLQGFGDTKSVASMSDLLNKIRPFKIDCIEIDGHDLQAIQHAFRISQTQSQKKRPLLIYMNTTKGKGVSYMENKMEWHYLPMTKEQYEIAVKEVQES